MGSALLLPELSASAGAARCSCFVSGVAGRLLRGSRRVPSRAGRARAHVPEPGTVGAYVIDLLWAKVLRPKDTGGSPGLAGR